MGGRGLGLCRTVWSNFLIDCTWVKPWIWGLFAKQSATLVVRGLNSDLPVSEVLPNHSAHSDIRIDSTDRMTH